METKGFFFNNMNTVITVEIDVEQSANKKNHLQSTKTATNTQERGLIYCLGSEFRALNEGHNTKKINALELFISCFEEIYSFSFHRLNGYFL